MEPLEVRIGPLLRARNLKLAVAESCTGGLVASRITDVSGSSDYLLGGVVAYAYDAKVGILGVTWETLQAHGAVSAETVLEMARGARRIFPADVAVAISGVAGPGGGSADKPVGTTYVALVAPEGEWSQRHQFQGDRLQNKAASADAALSLLWEYLNGSTT
ncbi:MAG TPA: CinA family protein [Anaerolineales bacterium]|jgi:PncC family amidohydrolase